MKPLHEQAKEKLAREAQVAQELAAWERELSEPDYYTWFLDQVMKEGAR